MLELPSQDEDTLVLATRALTQQGARLVVFTAPIEIGPSPQTLSARLPPGSDVARAAQLLGVTVPERAREPFATAPPGAIGAPELRDFFNYLKGARGHHMALAAIAAINSVALARTIAAGSLGSIPNSIDRTSFDAQSAAPTPSAMPAMATSSTSRSTNRRPA